MFQNYEGQFCPQGLEQHRVTHNLPTIDCVSTELGAVSEFETALLDNSKSGSRRTALVFERLFFLYRNILAASFAADSVCRHVMTLIATLAPYLDRKRLRRRADKAGSIPQNAVWA